MTTSTAPRHAGNRSTILKDMAMRIRYMARYVFDTREYAAYADRPSERAAYGNTPQN